MINPASDMYYFLLEHPNERCMEAFGKPIEYQTPSFSKDVYEESRQKRFSSVSEAYSDWRDFGRQAGLEYAPGKNTTLRIILKVKDDPYLTRKWIDYHSKIAGAENIIIMDCGSEDEKQESIYEEIKDKIIVIKYNKFYNFLHDTAGNSDFYSVVSGGCKYVSVLDADEFVFGRIGREISPSFVQTILSGGSEDVLAGTWIPNLAPPQEKEGSIDWESPIEFGISNSIMQIGTTAGKTIVRSTKVMNAKHVGHILHVPAVMDLLRESSFGKIGVFHLTKLPLNIKKARALNHLHSKNIVPSNINDYDEVENYVATKISDPNIPEYDKVYIRRFLDKELPVGGGAVKIESRLLSNVPCEVQNDLSDMFESFDFCNLLQTNKNIANR